MANTAVIPRAHLIYGICLPIAVMLGYLLAQPYDSGSLAVVVLLISILSIPLLLRWHHSILIFSLNAPIMILIPGRPMLWSIMAVLGLTVVILNRTLGREVHFFRAPAVSFSLIFLALVVVATAYLNDGIHLHALSGGDSAGGKRYLFILCGIFVYFALSVISIKPNLANLAVATLFLSSLTGLVGYFAAFAGPTFYFLVELFPIEGAIGEMNDLTAASMGQQGVARFGALGEIGTGMACYLFARFGVRGLFDLTKPWRLLLLLLTIAGFLLSGFRSDLILFIVVFALIFYMEGLFRTRYFLIFSMVALLSMVALIPITQKLPSAVQRTLAFIPFLNIDPIVRSSADASTEWRLEMWQEIIPTIPQHLMKGKGYSMDGTDAYLVQISERMGFIKSYESAILAGDYHSGPLSIIIPFGIWGVIAFVWFMFAAIKVLFQNYRFGAPSLRKINTLLLAFFVAKLFMYLFIFGSLYSDFFIFAGLVGFSISLNNGVRHRGSVSQEVTHEPAEHVDQTPEYNF